MIIKNAVIFTEEQCFEKGDICISDGVFSSASEDTTELDAAGCYAIPGLIDLHFHGCQGYDFCDGTMEAVERIAEYEASVGVTGIAPATMTLPVEELKNILSVGAEYKRKVETTDRNIKADLLGINMEGPFISKVKKGAQDPNHIIPCNVKIAEDFLEASNGLVKFIGIAPEDNPDYLDFIKILS